MSQPHRAALSLSLNLLGRAYLGRAFEHCVFVEIFRNMWLLNPPSCNHQFPTEWRYLHKNRIMSLSKWLGRFIFLSIVTAIVIESDTLFQLKMSVEFNTGSSSYSGWRSHEWTKYRHGRRGNSLFICTLRQKPYPDTEMMSPIFNWSLWLQLSCDWDRCGYPC